MLATFVAFIDRWGQVIAAAFVVTTLFVIGYILNIPKSFWPLFDATFLANILLPIYIYAVVAWALSGVILAGIEGLFSEDSTFSELFQISQVLKRIPMSVKSTHLRLTTRIYLSVILFTSISLGITSIFLVSLLAIFAIFIAIILVAIIVILAMFKKIEKGPKKKVRNFLNSIYLIAPTLILLSLLFGKARFVEITSYSPVAIQSITGRDLTLVGTTAAGLILIDAANEGRAARLLARRARNLYFVSFGGDLVICEKSVEVDCRK